MDDIDWVRCVGFLPVEGGIWISVTSPYEDLRAEGPFWRMFLPVEGDIGVVLGGLSEFLARVRCLSEGRRYGGCDGNPCP